MAAPEKRIETMKTEMTMEEFQALKVQKIWEIVDLKTKAVIAKGLTFPGAHRSADRRDLQYGAVRYRVRETGRA